MAATVATQRPIITAKNVVLPPKVTTDVPSNVWEVFLPLVIMRTDGTESGKYCQITYYVTAESAEKAVEIAQSWLPRKYELDDSPTARPFEPVSAAELARIRRERINSETGN